MNIILFWSSKLEQPDESFEKWRNRSIKMSPFHDVTLRSHLKFNHNVKLYTYQEIETTLPPEIEVLDANEFFPAEDAYKALLRGHSIAHISDIVRLLSAVKYNGVVQDLDNIVLNKYPDYECFTSSIPAKSTGGMAIKFGKNHQAFKTDGSWNGEALSGFPMKIDPTIHKEIILLANKIELTLSTKPSSDTKSWNYVMWTLKEIANNNQEVHALEPLEFCPVPVWKGSGKCYSLDVPTKFTGEEILYGYNLPSIEEIFKRTYAVQHFFESAFKGANALDETFWESIKEGSLLDFELNFILGTNWREEKIPNYKENELGEWD